MIINDTSKQLNLNPVQIRVQTLCPAAGRRIFKNVEFSIPGLLWSFSFVIDCA